MQIKSIAALIALHALPLIEAHTRFTTLYVDGVNQGDGTCIRMNMDASTTTTFVNGLTSDDMSCGTGGETAVARTCSANAGSSVSMLHRAWADGAKPGFIDASHKGSCAVYMKKVADSSASDPYSQSPAGDGWFKIFFDGYDESTSQWCTEKMIANGGILSASIPSDLAGGYYLLRSEILALQQVGNPQFYAGCAQIYLEGSGNAQPETVSIPGYISQDLPAMQFNVYSQPLALPYPEFGPAAYGSSSASSLVVRQSENTSSSQHFGQCPENTVLEIGNWCGVEVPSWTDTDANHGLPNCWAGSDACWATADDCWKNISPAINVAEGCDIWAKKCTALVTSCNNGATSGPPNAGTILTPGRATLGSSKRDVEMAEGARTRRMMRRRIIKKSAH